MIVTQCEDLYQERAAEKEARGQRGYLLAPGLWVYEAKDLKLVVCWKRLLLKRKFELKILFKNE